MIVNPLQRMVNDSRSVGIILFACSVLSIIIANVSAGETYIAFWNTATPGPPGLHLPHSALDQ